MKTKQEQKEIVNQMKLVGKLYDKIDELSAENKKARQRIKDLNKLVSLRLVLPMFEDCRDTIKDLTEEAYQKLLKEPNERKVITMSVLIKFYSEIKKISLAMDLPLPNNNRKILTKSEL